MGERRDPHAIELLGGLARRRFFERLAWGGLGLLAAASVPGTIRFLQPRHGAATGRAFDAGSLEEYAGVSVSSRWIKRHRVWVVKGGGRIFAIQARCTHLGCTPCWEPTTRLFRCPCHGSRFTPEGLALDGPAREPLARAAVWVEGNRLMIDPDQVAPLERAERMEGYFVRI